MATTMKARFPLLLLLGIVFLVSISVCYGNASPRQGNPCHEKCLRNCNRVNNANRRHECETRCEEWAQERCEEEEEEEEEQPRHREPGRREPWRRKESQPREEEEEEERRERPWRPWRPHQKEQGRKERQRGTEEGEEEEEREWRGPGRRGDPEERERTWKREERRWEKERRHRREREEREEGEVSESSGRNNPFFFSSNNFQTPYENENGYIRLVNRFDKRSKIFENLQNYRVLEYKAKPRTLILPHHADADSLLIIRSGRALLTLVYPNDRDSFNLDRGDSIRIPPGTTAYLANQDENEDLKAVKLVIPINRPGQFWHFFPATSQNQQSYLFGFSKNTLEAALNTEYEKIDRVLFGEHEQQETPEEGLIVKLSREDIQELGKHAKSSSKKTISSESKPFNLRQRDPIYSNQFGKFYEITPKRSPQLDELDIFLSWVEIKEGGLLLPLFNSRATVVGVVNEGEGVLELVGLKEEQQTQEEEEEEEEEEGPKNVHRYRAKLSPGDIIVIPASHPFAINASSDLNLLGFGINAEDNERNFLAGENDNMISQIHRAVIDLAFPGSAQDVERLMKGQKHSHFANAQPQQSQDGRLKRRSPLSSILGAFY